MRQLMNNMQPNTVVGLKSTVEITLKELEALKSVVMLAKVRCDRATAEPELQTRSIEIRTLAEKLHKFGLRNIEIK
ncbi:hypothetical protein ACSX1A_06795 [Pontibacter sp. MBLB2868]|uniref:hypothetical protein n=1 Tax=Pontibacter sp. MBLB2868 TaxID=3451555 RepID=UPI003F74BE92